MKPLPLILSFLPLIAFSLLTRVLPPGDVGVAGLVAALCAAVATVAVRRSGRQDPQCHLAGPVHRAGRGGFAGSAGTDRWLATWAGSGVGPSSGSSSSP